MSTETTTELVAEFARSVANQSEAVARGDATNGNGFAKRYIAAFEKLRGRGDAGRDALMTWSAESVASGHYYFVVEIDPENKNEASRLYRSEFTI